MRLIRTIAPWVSAAMMLTGVGALAATPKTKAPRTPVAATTPAPATTPSAATAAAPAAPAATAVSAPTPPAATAPAGKWTVAPEPVVGQGRILHAREALSPRDIEVARIAWKYFPVNQQASTGLVNSAGYYPSTTMWDAGSSIAAIVSAHEIGIITTKEFDDRLTALLGGLNTIKLYKGVAPNKTYNTATGALADYANKPSPGIGYSALDLARLMAWLDIVTCMYPRHANAAMQVIARWNFCDIVHDGQLWGTYIDPITKQEVKAQEGRLGYEQYAGKVLERLGFDQHVSASYKNKFARTTSIYDVPILYDDREAKLLGAYNYVVTESYALDAMEHGIDSVNGPLLKNIYEVQKRRWARTEVVTAVSEDNVDREPWFVYNTIFVEGKAWHALTDTGADQDALKTVSTKAAMSLAILFPDDAYSWVLSDQVASAYDPAHGYYSGVYERGYGYNKAITANTNGIILESLLYKMYGPLLPICGKFDRGMRPGAHVEEQARKNRCLPSASAAAGGARQ